MAASTEVLQLYGSSTTTTTQAAYIDVPYSGIITGVHWDIEYTAGAAATGYLKASVSRNATDDSATNNAKGQISGATLAGNVASVTHAVNVVQPNMAVHVHQGERLYLAFTHSGQAPSAVLCRCQLIFAA